MPVVEIIAIGTELLLGEIQDTNTRYLAHVLRDSGIDLYRATIVGDNQERIALAIREALKRCDILITSGGLGPTVDDPTRQAVAMALDTEIEFRPELWDQIQDRFKRYGRVATDNNRRQAFVPKGAIAVENPVGTAPAFIVETGPCAIISLPGVPRELEYLMENKVLPYLQNKYRLGVIKARVLHSAGVGESQIDDIVGDLETLSNPTVGLLAHSGQVDMRITAKAQTAEEAEKMIAEVEQILRQRLKNDIYGVDAQTLEKVVLETLRQRQWHLSIATWGMGNGLFERLQPESLPAEKIIEYKFLAEEPSAEKILSAEYFPQKSESSLHPEVELIASLTTSGDKQILRINLNLPRGAQTIERSYGGPPANGALWAANNILDILRRNF